MAASERNAVVVGAGLAGLAAAWELRKRGFRVTVLEREPQPGGRARSELVEGFTLEPLSPVLSTADEGLLAWIAEVGAGDELLPLRPLVTAQVRRNRVADLDARRLLMTPCDDPKALDDEYQELREAARVLSEAASVLTGLFLAGLDIQHWTLHESAETAEIPF